MVRRFVEVCPEPPFSPSSLTLLPFPHPAVLLVFTMILLTLQTLFPPASSCSISHPPSFLSLFRCNILQSPVMRHALEGVARWLCRFGTRHQLTANHGLQNLTSQRPNAISESQSRNSKTGEQVQNIAKFVKHALEQNVSRVLSRFLVGEFVRCNSKVRLASMVFPVASLSPKGDPQNVSQALHKTIVDSVSQVVPVSVECSPWCLPRPSHAKEYFPCHSQVLHTVLTELCTCQSVVPTLWFVCYLTLRVPPLLGGGGGGVSGGGSEGLTVSSASASSPKNTSCVDTRFRTVHLHQVLRRLAWDQRSRTPTATCFLTLLLSTLSYVRDSRSLTLMKHRLLHQAV